jgi:hypothetical protein
MLSFRFIVRTSMIASENLDDENKSKEKEESHRYQ